MEFTFHNWYIIIELVPSTVIFWTELSRLHKSYLSKTTLLLGWSHRYKNSTVVITIWLTVTKYQYLKWQWIFYFIRRLFFPLSLSVLLPDLTWYMSNMVYTLWTPEFTPCFLVESVFLLFLVFCVVLLCFFTFLVPCCDVRYDFHIKNNVWFVFTPKLFVGGLMSYLCYLCLFAYSVVQHILCCGFLHPVYPMLPVSLDCPFFIAHSVFSNVYYEVFSMIFISKFRHQCWSNHLVTFCIK